MITGVVVCPHPLLLAAPNRCAIDPVADLRAACLDALLKLPTEPLVVVGSADAHRSSTPQIRAREPLSIRVGRALLSQDSMVNPRREIIADTGRDTLREVVDSDVSYVVLVMADGSARRAEAGGPGVYDARAASYDQSISDALATGDPGALGSLDPQLGRELMVAGLPALLAMSLLPRPASANLRYAQAPFGVGYFVAEWSYAEAPISKS